MYNTYYKTMTPKDAYNYLKDNKPQDKELDYNNLFFLSITELYTEIYRTIIYSTSFLESIILKNPYYIYTYIENVIKSRWEEGENILLEHKEPRWICEYAEYVIKGRWSEAEKVLLECKDPEWIYYYAEWVIEERWPKGEPIILNSSYCEDYKRSFNIP